MPKDSVASLFGAGLRDFKAGRFTTAEKRIRRALTLDSQHTDSLYLAGLLQAKGNKIDSAIDFVTRAIRINQSNREYFSALGALLTLHNRFEEALKSYNIALKLAAGHLGEPELTCLGILSAVPSHIDNLASLGNFALQRGEAGLARDVFEHALTVNPDNAPHHISLANALSRLARHDDAESHFRAALRLEPDNLDAHLGLGNMLRDQKRMTEALLCFSELVKLQPEHPTLHAICGNILDEMGRLQEAEFHYRQACHLKPDYFEIFNNLGNVLRATGRPGEAEAQFRHALSLRPDSPEANNNLGNLLLECRREDEAEAYFRKALQLSPEYMSAHNGLASALVAREEYDAAEFHCREAIRLKPDFAQAYNNLGTLFGRLCRLTDAVACFREAVKLQPDYHEAYSNLGMSLLGLGEFWEGWQAYDTRKIEERQDLKGPRWAGEDLDGRLLLVYAEQGYGDVIQFCRFIPLIAPRVKVVLEVHRELVALLSNLPGIHQIVARGDPLPAYDAHCALLSLPRWLGIKLEHVSGEKPYLSADPQMRKKWRNRIGALPGLRVGLVWAGNPALASDRRRSIGLDKLGPLAELPGVSFVSLQKGPAALKALSPPAGMLIHDWTEELHDFSETAALICELDLVITVDTAVVHLAGALGQQVWMLNRFDSCWRWQIDNEGSPWYKTFRQFKQPKSGDWVSVIEQAKAALASYAKSRD